MNGLKFYLEYPNKTAKNKGTRKEPGDHSGNVVAVVRNTGIFRAAGEVVYYQHDAISAIFNHPNSDVAGSTVSAGYIQQKCKYISESVAREIHPNLFVYLDN